MRYIDFIRGLQFFPEFCLCFLFFLHLLRGEAKGTLQISRDKSEQIQSELGHGSHRVWEFVFYFAYEIAFLHFRRGEAQGT